MSSYSGGWSLSPSNPILMVRHRTPPLDKRTAGEYACAASNEMGEGPWTKYNLVVKCKSISFPFLKCLLIFLYSLAPPKLLQGLPPTIGAQSNESFTLQCSIQCEPLCSIHWTHNNLTSLSPDSLGVLISPIKNELRAKLRNGNELVFWLDSSEHIPGPNDEPSAFSYTVSRLHILNTSALFDHDQFMCTSGTDPGASHHSNVESVSSITTFRREYSPHSVQISVPQIDLLEGERYPEKPVQCAALGNPTPNYYWTFTPLLTSGQHSSKNHGVHKHRLHKNHEHHDHQEQQSVVGIGPRLTLNMTTMSSPTTLIPAQQQQNGFFTSSVEPTKSMAMINARISEQQSMASATGALFRASRSQSGNYTCVASNRHGTSTVTMTINVFCKFPMSIESCVDLSALQIVPSVNLVECPLLKCL